MVPTYLRTLLKPHKPIISKPSYTIPTSIDHRSRTLQVRYTYSNLLASLFCDCSNTRDTLVCSTNPRYPLGTINNCKDPIPKILFFHRCALCIRIRSLNIL